MPSDKKKKPASLRSDKVAEIARNYRPRCSGTSDRLPSESPAEITGIGNANGDPESTVEIL